LHNPNSEVASVIHRLDEKLLRLDLFNFDSLSIDENQLEVSQEIKNLAEDFSLSEDELNGKLQQLSDNKIRSINEQEKLENKQFDLFGIRLPNEKLTKDIEDASSHWLYKDAIQNLVELYLSKKFASKQDYILGEKEQKTLRLSQEMRSSILKDMQIYNKDNSKLNRNWHDWLKGSQQHLPITFDSKYAMRNKEVAFIMPLHPLVKIAAEEITNEKGRILTSLTISDATLPEGIYPFIVFAWHYIGIRNDLKLINISINSQISDKLDYLLTNATNLNEEIEIDSLSWDKISDNHYTRWAKERNIHKENTIKQVNYKKASLESSFKARISLLKDQLSFATNDKIKRMKESQIQTAEVDFARRYQDLDIATERTDINTKPIMYGLIKVVGRN
jgi:hypothetical protein